MTSIKYISLAILVLVSSAVFGQEQYLNLYLTKEAQRNIHIDTQSYISYGSVDTREDSSDHILLHRIEADSSATIYVNFEDQDSNVVFTGFVEDETHEYYGILFRNDTCYAYTDSLLTFLMTYQESDSLAVVKCPTDIQIFLKDSIMYAYYLDTFYNDFDVVVRVHEAPHVPHMRLSYHLYGTCDTIRVPEPEAFPTYISVNYQYNRSYAVVEDGYLHLRYFERYHVTKETDTVQVFIYTEDNPTEPLYVFPVENHYGNNFLDLDLSVVPGMIDNQFYMIHLEGSNKESRFYLRIYKKGNEVHELQSGGTRGVRDDRLYAR